MGVATDLGRLQEIARVLIRHGYGHLMGRSRPLKRAAESDAQGDGPPGDVVSSADRFASMLEQLGPTFVKLGQILSTRTDLLPARFIEALSRLQDHVPPLPYEVIREQVEQALGQPLHQLFASFSPDALASASIAQVHSATLTTGEEVVVKVQRPNIRQRMEADISLLGIMASVFDAVFEEAGVYNPKMVVAEFEQALLAELDFSNELRNLHAFYNMQMHRGRLRIPKAYPALCNRTVLVMELIRGTRLSDLPEDADRAAIALRFLETAFEQVFVDGLFHGDPHPGNVLILDDGTVALLDFGLVGRLTRDAQDRLVALLLATALRDPDSLARLLYRLGSTSERVELQPFRSAIANLLDTYMGVALQDIKSQALMRDLLDLTAQHRIRVPREYAVLGKAAVTFEGVIRDLHPTLDVAAVATPYAIRLLKERYDPRRVEGGAPRLLLQLIGFAQELPLQASQILMDLEAGKLTVRVSGQDIQQLSKSVRMLAVSVVTAAVAAVLAGAAIPPLMEANITILGLPLVPVLALASSLTLVAGVSFYVLWEGRFPKVRLRGLLRRLLEPPP